MTVFWISWFSRLTTLDYADLVLANLRAIESPDSLIVPVYVFGDGCQETGCY